LNTLEFLADIFKSYSQVKETRLNVGEVMNLWTMLTATEHFMSSEEVARNTVKDEALRKKITDLSENYHQMVISEIKKILLDEGVELPPSPIEKPKIVLDLPIAGRMTDEEAANLIVFNLVWAINFCARALTESVRADIGTLFAKYIVEKTAFSLTVKTLMAEKGWIRIPPVYKPK
jgi:hypothetical protein